jgi:thiamine pyrophosphokinase
MKRAVIFYNGDLSQIQKAKMYIKPTDFIICADGGALHAEKNGIKPDVIIGDFDSMTTKQKDKFAKQKIAFVVYTKQKDETDSELAVHYALKKGFRTILILGFMGSRLDHMLTNLFALDYLTELKADITIVEGDQEIRLVKKYIKLKGKKGDLLSLIPLKEDAKKVTTKNLQYPLKQEDLLFGYSRGISNVFTKSTAEISLTNGSLLVIHTRV